MKKFRSIVRKSGGDKYIEEFEALDKDDAINKLQLRNLTIVSLEEIGDSEFKESKLETNFIEKNKRIILLFIITFSVLGIFAYSSFLVKREKAQKVAVEIAQLFNQVKLLNNEIGGLDAKDLEVESEIKNLCQEIIRLNKDKIYNFTILAYAHYRLKDYEKAFSLLNEALKTNERDAMAHTLLARIYNIRGDSNAALSELNMAYEFQNSEVLSYIFMTYSAVYNKLGNYKKVCEYTEKSLELDERCLTAYLTLSKIYFYDLQDYNKTVQICERGLQFYPDRYSLLFLLGNAYNLLDEPTKALDALKKTENLECGEVGQRPILLGLVYAYLKLGNYIKAREYAERNPELFSEWLPNLRKLDYMQREGKERGSDEAKKESEIIIEELIVMYRKIRIQF